MEDILYINSATDVRIKEMVEIIPSKDKELPNLIILTILSAGAGLVTPIFSNSGMGTTIFTSVNEIGTKFILDEKEITSDDFLIVTKLQYGINYNFFGLLFEDSNEHTLKISLINPSIPNFQRINSGPGYSANSITSVVIGNSITDIDSLAFKGCTKLTSITIGNSMTEIDSNNFNDAGLTSIVVSPGNKVYDSRDNCNAIIETKSNTLVTGCSSTVIPNSVTQIGDRAFSGCSGLTSIIIHSLITSIGEAAFAGCGLTSVIIPDSVTEINKNTFNYCTNLTSVDIPDSVTKIGDMAFYSCFNLTLVNIPNSVTLIGYGAFNSCNRLTSVTIGNLVTEIGEVAFVNCTNLSSVTIPNSVTTIGSAAFSGCMGLTSVNIPNSVTNIGKNAFSNCNGITSLTWNAVNCPSNGDMATGNIEQLSIGNEVQILPDNFVVSSKITSVTIPNSVTTIGKTAFAGCGKLTSVSIGKSVTTIGNLVFGGTVLSSIISLATTAPSISNDTFYGIKSGGTLHVPAGSDYSTWMSTDNYYLGKYNWTKVEDA